MKFFIVFILFHLLYLAVAMPVFSWGFVDWSLLMFLWGGALWLYCIRNFWRSISDNWRNQVWFQILKRMFPPGTFGDDRVVDLSTYQPKNEIPVKRLKGFLFGGTFLILVGLLNSFVFPVITSTPLFFSQNYRNLLGTVEESSFTQDVEPISVQQIRIIDTETARKLAEKKIGEVPALGSETQMGELVLQKIKNKLYYVAPLEYRGIFQWLTNRSQGTGAYIMVSATNPQDVHLVQNVNGQELHIRYQMKAFLLDFLPRYLYVHGIVNVGMTDFSFEVDDELRPYWVATLYRNKVGYSGSDAVGVVTVDAQTGEISRYQVGNAPEWIDRIQPERMVYQQVAAWGEYVNGFWNALLTKTGTLKPADNSMHLIYGNDNQVYWYTGITSSGKDESTVGFILVDSRTKQAKWYKVSGATEEGARKSAEGQVQEKGYRAGYPVLYNVGGIPTYIASLKDKEGLLKAVALVSVENYNIVGVGADVESALRNYRQSLAGQNYGFVPGNEVKELKLQGKVLRINPVVKGGESYFYFTLDSDSRIFVGSVQTAPRLALTAGGDRVEISLIDTGEAVLPIRTFNVLAQ